MVVVFNGLERRVREEFPYQYRRFGGIIDSGYVWEEFRTILGDKELLSHIRFCNDVMKVPPVRTHLMIAASRGWDTMKHDLQSQEKQSLGALYGFLFKEIMGYTQQESVSCVINTVKTATRFSGGPDEIIWE